MVTPRTCRLCHAECESHRALCKQCTPGLLRSGEYDRAMGIRDEHARGEITEANMRARQDIALTNYITRVLAEREVERGRG